MKWKLLGILMFMVFTASSQTLTVNTNKVCAKSAVDFAVKLPLNISNYESVLLQFADGKEVELTSQYNYSKHRYFYEKDGTYKPQLIVKEKGKTAITVKSDAINVLPIPDFGIINRTADSLCFNDTFILQGPWQDRNKRKITNWSWKFGDGTQINALNVEKRYLTPGDYALELECRIESGCWGKTERKLKVHEPFNVDFKVFGTDQHEAGSVYTFKNKSQIDNATIKSWIWDWGSGGRKSRDTFSFPNDSALWQIVSRTYKAEGYSSPKLLVIDQNGCKDSMLKKDVIRILKFRFDVTWFPDTPCFSGNEIQFNMPPRPNATQIVWNFGDSIKSIRFNENTETWRPSHSFTHPGYYNVNLKIIEPPVKRNFDTTTCFVKVKGTMAKIRRNDIKNSFADIHPFDTSKLKALQKDHIARARKGLDSIRFWEIEKVAPFIIDSLPQYFNAPLKTYYEVENSCGGDTIFKPVYELKPTSYKLVYQNYRVLDSGYWHFNDALPSKTLYHPPSGRKYVQNMHDSDLYHPAPYNLVSFTNNSIKYRLFGKKRSEKPMALRYAWDNVPGEFPDKGRNPNFPWASDSMQYLWFFDDASAKNCTSTVTNPNVRCAYSTEVAPIHMYNKMGLYHPILKVFDTICGCEHTDTITINMLEPTLLNSKGKALTWYEQNAKIRRGEGDYGFRISGYNCTNQLSDQKADFNGLPFDEKDIENYWLVFDADEQCDTILYRYWVGGHLRDTLLRKCDWISRDSLKKYRYGYNYKTGGWKTVGAIIKVGKQFDTLFIENYKWVNDPVPNVKLIYNVEPLSDSFELEIKLTDKTPNIDSVGKIRLVLHENRPLRRKPYFKVAFEDSFSINKGFSKDYLLKLSSKNNFELNVFRSSSRRNFKDANSCLDGYSRLINHKIEPILKLDSPFVCINQEIKFIGGANYFRNSKSWEYSTRFRDAVRDSVFGAQWVDRLNGIPFATDSSFFSMGYKAPKRLKWQQNPKYSLPDFEEQIAWDFDEDSVFDTYGSKVQWTYKKAGVYQPQMYVRDSTGFWQRYKTRSPITVYYSKPLIEALGDTQLYCIDGSFHKFNTNTQNIKKYYWSINDELKDTSSQFEWIPLNAGNYKIDLLVVDEHNCRLSAPTKVVEIAGPKAAFSMKAFEDSCKQEEIVLYNKSKEATELNWFLNGNQIGKTAAFVDSFIIQLPYWGTFYISQLAVAEVYDSTDSELKSCSDGHPDGGKFEFDMLGTPNSRFSTHRNEGASFIKIVPEDTTADYYLWTIDKNVVSKKAPGIIYHSFQNENDFDVCLKLLHNNCESETCKTVWVSENTLNGLNAGIDVTIYPNPASDFLNIEAPQLIDRVEVYNSIGELVQQSKGSSKNIQIPTANWSLGIYSVKIYIYETVVSSLIVKE